MAKRKNYPEEFRRDAVPLARSSKDRSLTDIARSLGSHLETLRKWIRDDRALGVSSERDTPRPGGGTLAEAGEQCLIWGAAGPAGAGAPMAIAKYGKFIN
ncbi:transposase [Streptomyces sp. NBC_00316]|uniref:transposase n=1 Tax=Streptomyces sp. NBC_00316 TaxID=2975710 RepID=UPI002E281E6C|nr:transposase [Streptomyces sp. NBC_00316]